VSDPTKVEPVWISATVPLDLKQAIEGIAARDERSVAWVVRQALKRYADDFGVRRAA
jgi:predicted transcriptional regulator